MGIHPKEVIQKKKTPDAQRRCCTTSQRTEGRQGLYLRLTRSPPEFLAPTAFPAPSCQLPQPAEPPTTQWDIIVHFHLPCSQSSRATWLMSHLQGHSPPLLVFPIVAKGTFPNSSVMTHVWRMQTKHMQRFPEPQAPVKWKHLSLTFERD